MLELPGAEETEDLHIPALQLRREMTHELMNIMKKYCWKDSIKEVNAYIASKEYYIIWFK